MQACCTVLYPVLMPMMAKRKINYVVNTVVTGPVLSLPLAQILMTYRYIIIPTEELISWTAAAWETALVDGFLGQAMGQGNESLDYLLERHSRAY